MNKKEPSFDKEFEMISKERETGSHNTNRNIANIPAGLLSSLIMHNVVSVDSTTSGPNSSTTPQDEENKEDFDDFHLEPADV